MLDNDQVVKVKNREPGTVGYTIHELNNLRRSFAPKEIKEIKMSELRALSYVPGGLYILKNCLVINEPEAVKELIGEVEPEYFYDEARVKDLLLNGSLDQLLDCLDFAPTGVVDLVKNLAVELKINDIAKREAIKDKTGFNVDSAVKINEETEEKTENSEKTRRAATPATTVASGRRTATPAYKIVK